MQQNSNIHKLSETVNGNWNLEVWKWSIVKRFVKISGPIYFTTEGEGLMALFPMTLWPMKLYSADNSVIYRCDADCERTTAEPMLVPKECELKPAQQSHKTFWIKPTTSCKIYVSEVWKNVPCILSSFITRWRNTGIAIWLDNRQPVCCHSGWVHIGVRCRSDQEFSVYLTA